jgi:hypothetical protein
LEQLKRKALYLKGAKGPEPEEENILSPEERAQAFGSEDHGEHHAHCKFKKNE